MSNKKLKFIFIIILVYIIYNINKNNNTNFNNKNNFNNVTTFTNIHNIKNMNNMNDTNNLENIHYNHNYTTNIHISINADKKYLYPSIVFITSLLENKNPSSFYNIHLLASSNSIFEYKNEFNTFINKYGNTSINISYIDMRNDFVGAISGKYISTAAYNRIALSSLLPNLDRIIYCDSDVINFKDLTEMYNLEINDTIYERRIRFLFYLFLN